MRDMNAHKRAKEPAVVTDAQVQEFVHDDNVLKMLLAVRELRSEGHRSTRRAGAPLLCHSRNAHGTRAKRELLGPILDAAVQAYNVVEI